MREQYEITWKDYYEILQVHPSAEPEVIAAAYRRLALMYHPDKNPSPAAERKFKDINEANAVLSDPGRRSTYELAYSRNQSGGRSSDSHSSRQSRSYSANDFSGSNYYDDQGYEPKDDWYDSGPHQEAQPNTQAQSHNPPPESIFSLAFLRYLATKLLDKMAPNPDESQRILPWPSWQLQKISLAGCPVLAGLSVPYALANGAWEAIIFATFLLAVSIYAGKATGWMRNTNKAPGAARLAGGACIILSGISWGLGVAYGIFAIVMMVFFFRLMGVMFMAMLEGGFNKYR